MSRTAEQAEILAELSDLLESATLLLPKTGIQESAENQRQRFLKRAEILLCISRALKTGLTSIELAKFIGQIETLLGF